MSVCKFSEGAGLYSVTPLDNIFIQEYMLRAPGDYVKIYIYALMQCTCPETAEPTKEKFCRSLGMPVEQVDKALNYWMAKGLIKKGMNDSFELINVRTALFDSPHTVNESALFDAELSNRIAEIILDRQLMPAQYELIYELKELYGFDDDAVAIFCEHCIKAFSQKKLTLQRMESIAREWRQKGLTTGEKAQEYLLGAMLSKSPANKLLLIIGISYRKVTLEEHKLYEKWTNEWSFSPEAIIESSAQMKSIQNPNFKYLDKIIEGLHERGLYTLHKIQSHNEVKEEDDKRIQKCSYRLGLTGFVTDEQRLYFTRWTKEYGMSDDAILLICDIASSQGMGTFKHTESIISQYARRGLITAPAINEYRKQDADASQIFSALGERRMPTLEDVRTLGELCDSLSFEVALEGAQYSSSARRPFNYLVYILNAWKAKGITTVAQAREEYKRNKSSYTSGITRDYQQHEYKPGELDSLFEVLGGEN